MKLTKRILTILLALLPVLSLPITALAAQGDVLTGTGTGGDTLISDDAVRAIFAMDAADEIVVK